MIPLPLFADLPTPEETRQWDQAAQKTFGIDAALLMENAGQAAFAALARRVALTPQTRVLVVMGRGNNGGDGAVIARLAHERGCSVLVCHSGPLGKLPLPARRHAAIARKAGVPFLPVRKDGGLPLAALRDVDQDPEWRAPDVVVDGITGTGIRGDLRERELALVRAVNAFAGTAFVLALDIPSGLCGYTGHPRPEAVRADLTVTFEAGKPGLYVPEAGEYTGAVEICSVGIPQAARRLAPPAWRLLSPRPGAWASPPPMRHKGAAGKVLIVGGSEGMSGAPVLAALGALRAGAGLVHLACPGGLAPGISAAWPEILVHPVGGGSRWTEEDAPALLALMRPLRPGAVILGPGMGRRPEVSLILKAILQKKDRCPVLLDADALHFLHLPDHRAEARERHAPQGLDLSLLGREDIVTPHPGEMAKMLPCSFFSTAAAQADPGARGNQDVLDLHACIGEVQEDRAGALRAFTRVCDAVVVLKGPGTLVGRKNDPIALAPFAVASLGVGGSGDVLSGICAALAAGGLPSLEAACLGVYLHGRAGELLDRRAPRGHLAREIADALPRVWNELRGR